MMAWCHASYLPYWMWYDHWLVGKKMCSLWLVDSSSCGLLAFTRWIEHKKQNKNNTNMFPKKWLPFLFNVTLFTIHYSFKNSWPVFGDYSIISIQTTSQGMQTFPSRLMVTRWSWTSLMLYLLDPTLSHIQNGWQLNITWLVVVCLQNHSITNSLHVFKHVELVNAQSEVRQLFAKTWCMIIL